MIFTKLVLRVLFTNKKKNVRFLLSLLEGTIYLSVAEQKIRCKIHCAFDLEYTVQPIYGDFFIFLKIRLNFSLHYQKQIKIKK